MGGRWIGLCRNVAVLLGLWTGCFIVVATPVGLVQGALPNYVASSTKPGSEVVMYLSTSAPFLATALAAGYLLPLLIESSRPMAWAVALSSLFVLFHFSSGYSFGWQWVQMGGETRLGGWSS
jgi:hypothetical protein